MTWVYSMENEMRKKAASAGMLPSFFVFQPESPVQADSG